MSNSMKAIGFDHYGSVDHFKLVSLPVPKAIGKDLLVKVYSFAINPVDYKLMRNFGRSKENDPVTAEKAPVVVGFDAAGVVSAVGNEVTKFKVGDDVYFAGDFTRAGSYAEFVLVDERIVARKPKSLSWAAAASVPLVALTAYEAIHEQMHVGLPATLDILTRNKSKSILIVAGAGGVGSIATQLAKNLFHIGTVIATASRPESIKFCKEHGADHAVSHQSPLAPQLKALGLSGVDYVLNCADAADAAELIALLNPFGYFCTIVGFSKDVNLSAAMFKRLTITTEIMFGRSMHNVEAEKQGVLLAHVAHLLDSHVIQHTCTKVFNGFTLANLVEATKLQESSHHMGKIAVTIVSA